jgi:signal transduction histidine kinase
MGVIQGHAKLLEPKVSDEQARWRLQTIQEQIARISKIIQSLLSMARPARGVRQPVELEPLLRNTLSFLREKLQRRRIEVKCRFAPAPSVQGDPERLQQVFLNLFMNAADATPEGGELRVALRGGPVGEAIVEVEDTGPGIGEEDAARIFEPFFTTKPAGQGSGLGLAVVQGIVAEHGGTIELESPPGAGARFTVTLPTPDLP